MVPYIGGKARIADWIISMFPEHKSYVEVFGGAGWVMLDKEPSALEVYNDIDNDLINLFRVVQDPEKCRKLANMYKWALHSRSEFVRLRNIWRLKTYKNDIEHAYCFSYYMCAARLGKRSGMSFKISKVASAKGPASLQSFARRLLATRNRLKTVIIESLDYVDLIKKYDTPQTLFYLDPPYIKSDYYYCVNWTKDDHRRLSNTLSEIKGKFILSYYDSSLVRSLYPWCQFTTKDVAILCYQDQHNHGCIQPRATELLITNFKPNPCNMPTTFCRRWKDEASHA